ncbi:MAG: hypothetical protein LVQ95_05025 [Candidatus Micrarchaeales archaeon]|nr:hypothetical protein [Candidatus Micrarchaeales archaeon]
MTEKDRAAGTQADGEISRTGTYVSPTGTRVELRVNGFGVVSSVTIRKPDGETVTYSPYSKR